MLGSTALFGGVDTLLTMRNRGDLGRTVETIQRVGTPLSETTLRFDTDTRYLSTGHSLGTAKILLIEEAVFRTLDEGPLSRADLLEAVGMDRNKVSRAICRLVESGDVLRTGRGKSGDPFRYERGL